ncbi:LOW QUALITY PROTEIN: vomeronasal type-1 receptor 2-like [Dugong dugon]
MGGGEATESLTRIAGSGFLPSTPVSAVVTFTEPIILVVGVPQTMLAFGLKHFLSDFGCKPVVYLQRVARGMSICTTCLLSVFQTITISPMHSRWAELKQKALKYIGPTNILCWILHMLVNAIFPIYVTGKWSNDTIIKKNVLEYCSTTQHDNVILTLYAALISSHDVLCLGFMSWASGSIVFILYRHKQWVQHIHKKNISPRSSVETRATQSILVLVSTFVSFYALSSIIYAYLAVFDNPSWWLVKAAGGRRQLNRCVKEGTSVPPEDAWYPDDSSAGQPPEWSAVAILSATDAI